MRGSRNFIIASLSLLTSFSSVFAEAPNYSIPSELVGEKVLTKAGTSMTDSEPYENTSLRHTNTSNFRIVFDGIQADPKGTVRGAKEVKLYKKISPSVVLISNGDGLGSGSVISRDGLILTNHHVVGNEETVGVFFKPSNINGQIKKDDLMVGRVIKVDPSKDLALIKLQQAPEGIYPISIDPNLESYPVGTDVHAIGHPTGQTWTYTKGYISQIRPGFEWGTSERQYKHRATVIQTQTPINPGNSGGPLLNDEGKLIGVNSFKSKDAEGLNFAVSAKDVSEFLKSRASATPRASNRQGTCPEQPKEINRGEDTDGAKVRVYDSNCNNKADFEVRIPKSKEDPVLVLFDRNEDGRPDVVVFDFKHDKFFDLSFHDVDFDGVWDLMGEHPDGKLIASSFRPYE